MVEQEKDDDERCPLCPTSGPPTRSTIDAGKSGAAATNGKDNDLHAAANSSLFWIACSKCSTWFHSCCLLLADGGVRESIPQAVRDEVEKNSKGEGPFQDWTVWINRWYCKSCLDLSNDPSNPNKPHHPLVTTTKANFPPRQPKRKSIGAVRGSSSSSRGISEAPAKRAKVEAAEEAGQGEQADESSSTARPKRQAALNRPDYHALHHHIATPTGKWLRLIADPEKYNTTILDGDFPRIRGDMVTKAWIEARLDQADSSGSSAPGSLFYGTTREPLIVRPEDGGFEAMGGKLPDKSFTVQDVARLVGPDRQVDVIDVATQSSAQWTLKQWAEYVRTGVDPTGNSSKVYNIISLEITGTELAKRVRAPRLVREIDWVDNFWNFPGGKGVVVDEKNHQTNGINETEGKLESNREPNGTATKDLPKVNGVKAENESTLTNGIAETKPKGKAPSSWPKVQLYCLMGMKGSWTDWHVDFAASSVYYTIHTGSKVFYFIRPTEKNLKAYNEWSGSYEMQQNTWLGDMCDEVRRVVLIEGDTMIIPAGYIHAVYTPMNSIVFGGNFVHSYDIPAQLRLRQIEIDTKVPQRFRFPLFDKLCWYVADRYCSDLRACRAYRVRALSTLAPPHSVVLEGLVHLANFLISQTDIIENSEEEDKKRSLVFNKIPHEIVKDPSGLARELLWRVKRELGHDANQTAVAEALQPPQATTKQTQAKPKPRKDLRKSAISRTVNFDPIPWESNDLPPEHITQKVNAVRPGSDGEREAELMKVVSSSYRRRVRETEDGRTVLEEQDVFFTQLRTVWDILEEEEINASVAQVEKV